MDTSKNTDASKRLETLANEAKNKFTLARKGSEQSLLNYKAVGDILVQAKALRPRGFGKWTKDTLDIGKQWTSNLVFLSVNWSDYQGARSWAEDKGEILG